MKIYINEINLKVYLEPSQAHDDQKENEFRKKMKKQVKDLKGKVEGE